MLVILFLVLVRRIVRVKQKVVVVIMFVLVMVYALVIP